MLAASGDWSISETHVDFTIDDADVVSADPDLRILLETAGADLIAPAVPGTGHDIMGIDRPFAERTGMVEAEVVERMEAVGEPEQRDVTALDLDEVSAGTESVGNAHRHELPWLRHPTCAPPA